MRQSALERLREIRAAEEQPQIGTPPEDDAPSKPLPAVPTTPASAVLDIIGRSAPISHPLILKEMQGRGYSKTISAGAIGELQAGRWIEHDLVRGYILSRAETDDVTAGSNTTRKGE